jgi:hypothetical protein
VKHTKKISKRVNNNTHNQIKKQTNFLKEFSKRYPRAIKHILSDLEKKETTEKSINLPDNQGQLVFKKNIKGLKIEHLSPKTKKNSNNLLINQLYQDIQKEKNINNYQSLAQKGLSPSILDYLNNSYSD